MTANKLGNSAVRQWGNSATVRFALALAVLGSLTTAAVFARKRRSRAFAISRRWMPRLRVRAPLSRRRWPRSVSVDTKP